MMNRNASESLHIVILGGGPAGSACGLALLKLATQIDRAVKVTILESKQFAGERHYNQCVGVLSTPLPDLMERELLVPFPTDLTQALITGYTLHGDREELPLEGDDEPSVALRRVKYDGYMLESAMKRGVEVLPVRATSLEFHEDGVIVYTDSAPVEGDVLVGAFGMDEGSAAFFSRQAKYKPPQALSSIVTKYHPGTEAMDAFGKHIHAFLPKHPRIEFGGITPKGDHLTINIAGRNVDAPLMSAFLKQPVVREALPNFEMARQYDADDLRYYKGRFPCSLARNYYGDRFVMIGDAAGLVRSFKGKGVTAAVQTGIRAAETILSAGFSRAAFDDHYRSANEDLISDMSYGQTMRSVVILMARAGMLDAVIRAARKEPRLRRALFGAVSGHESYRTVWGDSLAPASLTAILGAVLKRTS
ncbi:MAG: NAD(P)/FAD-dependent oxidoreductase [Anaerolineales bacterium]|nr:MAG: NAD(P)/FAD-dependent oxidoreductase [Anaerolineales bacterium]